MKALRTAIAVVLAFGMTMSMTGCSDSDVAAKVNGEVIKRSDLDAQIATLEEQYPDMFTGVDGEGALLEFQQRLLDNMIDQELIRQDAEEQGIEIADDDVQAQIDELKTGFPTDEEFEQVLSASGMSIEMLEEQVYESLLTDAIVEMLVSEIEFTDQEIEDYYETTLENWIEPATVHSAHILFAPEDEALAQDVLDQINDGGNFGALAGQYSQDPGSKDSDGDLGWATTDTYVPEFKEALESMEVGEVSGLVESSFGWHIIKLIETKDATERSLEEVTGEIEQLLMQEASAEAFQVYVTELRDGAEIEILMPELATPAVSTVDDEE